MRPVLVALGLLLVSASAAAGTDVHRLTWDVTVGGTPVGSRTATVTVENEGATATRVVEAFTEIDASATGAPFTWKQRLTVVADDGPASFHAVMAEGRSRREVQGRLGGDGWTVTVADDHGARTFDAPPSRIQLTTADLLDPMTSVPLSSFPSARVLSVETGDVWEGAVTALPDRTVTVKGKAVPVRGWAWASPEGTSSFWYDADGWLVRFETRVLGREVVGQLREPPPASADAFSVTVDDADVESTDL